jgi:hypothetical protein
MAKIWLKYPSPLSCISDAAKLAGMPVFGVGWGGLVGFRLPVFAVSRIPCLIHPVLMYQAM